ncbi:MAG: phosphatase PAP2 family protein [Bacteroidota bacterium]
MNIISVIFHPLLLATWLCGALLTIYPGIFPRIQPDLTLQFLLVLFLLTSLLPALSIVLLRSFSMISNFNISERKERTMPFLFITFYYLAASYLFIVKMQLGSTFITLMVSVSLLILLLVVMTRWLKVSVHAAAIWAASGYLIALTLKMAYLPHPILFILIIGAGLTSASRLYLGHHSPKEIWVGSITGFLYGFLVILLLL